MLKKTIIFFVLLFCILLFNSSIQIYGSEYKISGPITHKNLSIFLIHGDDSFIIEDLLILTEAIEQDKIKIHEKHRVSELLVENTSDNHIFIQSGDIVKGGKQDRVLRYDLVVYPHSGKIPLASFCVEQARWSKRGSENIEFFRIADKRISSKDLKIAAKEKASQRKVWQEVKVIQDKLRGSVGKSVKNPTSSSLQLTFENKEITKRSKEYIDSIIEKTKTRHDVIGYVFAINGEINSADIYANHELFNKMWLKLLEASSTEAISELNDSAKVKDISIDSIKE